MPKKSEMLCSFDNPSHGRALLLIVCSWLLCCCSVSAQTSATTTESIASGEKFEISGHVTSKSEDQFEVKTKDGETIEISVNTSTDFALRMASPWFDSESREVAVDGKRKADGDRERIKYALPDGKLYLLAEFRGASHRQRILAKPPWRINNYLISDEAIEPILPSGGGLLLAGELDLKNSKLVIGDESYPVILGFRGATLRGRSFEDIIAGETAVLVTGIEDGKTKTADTVIFMIR